MTKVVALRAKTYSYLTDDGRSDKKAKGTKKCVTKRILKFNYYKDCLLNNEIILKSQQRFKSEKHDVYTEEINKSALSSNDDKRLQTLIELHHILMGQVLVKYLKQTIKQSKFKMINFDNYTNENKIERNPKWPYIPDHPYRILIVDGLGSG